MNSASIENVSDTAIWVAYYRAVESARPDAIFKDILAKELIGDRGRQIAERMDKLSTYTQFNVVTRTVIIDEFIRARMNEVDGVVNLGAGLDTRPYRLSLRPGLKWIEVDYPHIIALKNEKLAAHQPACTLERVAVDLADDVARRAFLKGLSGKFLVLTEGVIPYLTEEQVAALAEDLHANPAVKYWIAEYISPQVYGALRSPKRLEVMKNAPFRFFPSDWMGFFEKLGWVREQIRYNGEVGRQLGRSAPLPVLAKILGALFPPAGRRLLRFSGYVLFKKS